MIPSLNVTTSETSASSGISMPYRLRGSANASMSTDRHSALTWSTRSRSSGRFHASACSSYQTFSYSTSSERRNRIAVRHFSMNGTSGSA